MNLLGKRKLREVTNIVRGYLCTLSMPVRRAEVSYGGQRFWCRAYIGSLDTDMWLYVNYKTFEVYLAPAEVYTSEERRYLELIIDNIPVRRESHRRHAELRDALVRSHIQDVMTIMKSKRLRTVSLDGFHQPWDNQDRRKQREQEREEIL